MPPRQAKTNVPTTFHAHMEWRRVLPHCELLKGEGKGVQCNGCEHEDNLVIEGLPRRDTGHQRFALDQDGILAHISPTH
ncbi:predicted protein [Lichtheimia corymbifera JMRC:FSU:9682]|uniref:Uncharacterized protein n=1 Tax=Lichtheimia corymbifera JMRC:FSU:9682 TaxID=1263082 RepID=A0A068RHM9_9FUNG|nr:predicted protein [Lichtheimia corymbifera JMRC:FSU:9682]